MLLFCIKPLFFKVTKVEKWFIGYIFVNVIVTFIRNFPTYCIIRGYMYVESITMKMVSAYKRITAVPLDETQLTIQRHLTNQTEIKKCYPFLMMEKF